MMRVLVSSSERVCSKMKKASLLSIRFILFLLTAALFCGGCSDEPAAPSSVPMSTEPTPTALPSTSCIAPNAPLQFISEEIPLDLTLSEQQRLIPMDALEDRLAFVVWERTIDEEKANAVHVTAQIIIFNAATGEIEKTWTPESPC